MAPMPIRRKAGAASTTVPSEPIQSTGRRPIRSESRPVSGIAADIRTRIGMVSRVPWSSS